MKIYVEKENSIKTRKKCSSTTLRATKLKFTQNRKIILVNIKFFHSNNDGTHTPGHEQEYYPSKHT